MTKLYKNNDGYVSKEFGITTQPIKVELADDTEYKKYRQMH